MRTPKLLRPDGIIAAVIKDNSGYCRDLALLRPKDEYALLYSCHYQFRRNG